MRLSGRVRPAAWREWLLLVAAAAGVVGCGRPSASADRGSAAALRVHEFRSAVFGNVRSLRVLVPPGYDDPAHAGRRYAVLYLNDGQNLFDSATAVLNAAEWHVDETVTALVRAGQIEPLLVVGVDNAGRRSRAREYLPFPDAFLQPPEPDPLGRRYPGFLVDEVLPFVAARYRTQAGPEQTGLGGSSYGALAALYTASVRPGVFGRLLLESPSLYVDSAAILALAGRVPDWPGRVYLGVGTHEMGGAERCRPASAGDGGEAVADVRRLAALLADRGLAPARLRVAVEPCGAHEERAWARRLPEALRFLYGPPSRPAP
jgi:predicted alpha/beta superfamily hydrolase